MDLVTIAEFGKFISRSKNRKSHVSVTYIVRVKSTGFTVAITLR